MMHTAYLLVLHGAFVALSISAAACVMAGCSWIRTTLAWFSDRSSRRFVRRVIPQPRAPSPEAASPEHVGPTRPGARNRAPQTLSTLPPLAVPALPDAPAEPKREHAALAARPNARQQPQPHIHWKLRSYARSH